MFRFWCFRVRSIPVWCRERLFELWYVRDRSGLAVLAIPAVVISVSALLVHFAYTGHTRAAAALERRAELRCLAENVYYEGRGEPLDGQYAIAEVTVNRVAAPQFPDTVCGVVHDKGLDRSHRR